MILRTLSIILSSALVLGACNGEKSGEEMESAINLYMKAVPFVGNGFRQCVEENIVQKGIKTLFDPKGILNPKKLFF